MRQPASTSFSMQRVGAMIMRYSYLLRSSWSRVLDLVYWPAVQMVTWGFLQTYLARLPQTATPASRATLAAGTLIGAIMLWDILFRGQLAFPVFSRGGLVAQCRQSHDEARCGHPNSSSP